MGVLHHYRFNSAQGRPTDADLADCVNVTRMPWAREMILKGQFHRVPNPDGTGFVNVEKRFVYIDFARGTYILVEPRGKRHRWLNADDLHRRMMARVPPAISERAAGTRRVVYGVAELREKLLAEDAGLDDRAVEFVKALLIYEHPVLLQRPRLRISLEGVATEQMHFTATHDHNDRMYRLSVPRSIVDGLSAKRPALNKWMDRKLERNLLTAPDGTWVNIWRLSPANRALAILQQVADGLPGTPAKPTSQDFQFMLQYLPRGSHLPAWAKKALHKIFLHIKSKRGSGKLQDKLWEIRFGRALDDDWYLNNDPHDIDTLWKLLKDLPDTNVEGNTALNEILLDPGGGGGFYSPGSGDITIEAGALGDQEWFEDVVRHEVGHAVHEMHSAKVDAWLDTRFGWRRFGTSNAAIDAWVALMGGYDTATPAQRSEIRGYIRTALGPGSKWAPGAAPVAPAGHPWNKPNFGPRVAFEKTGANWYTKHVNWHRSGGRAFFYNFYYAELMVVSASTLTLVKQMPDSYACMSPFEFFAEVYALYYDLDDPKRGALPQNVLTWLSANIGAAAPNQPARPGLEPRRFRDRPTRTRREVTVKPKKRSRR